MIQSVVQAVLAAQELNMNIDELIGAILRSISVFFALVLGALGIGVGHIIFVWCGVL